MSSALNRTGSRLVAWMLAVLVLVAGAFVATPAHAEGGASISGTVTDEAGTAAPGVHVVAYKYDATWGWWGWHSSTYVRADGGFSFAELPAGEYRLQFETGFASTSFVPEWWQDAADLQSATTVTLADGAAAAGVNASLTTGGSITGAVTDEQGAPVPGVSVRAYDALTGAPVSYATSDPGGAYALTGLRDGEYLVEFLPLDASGPVAGEWWDDAASRAEATRVVVTAGASTFGVDAVLGAAGTIGGVVTDETGAPAPNVYVAVYRATSDGVGDWMGSRVTDASGAYSLAGLPAGDYKLNFSTTGPLLGEWYDDAADAASATAVAVVGGARTIADARLTVGGSISGIITTESGEPVSNATVWIGRITPDGLEPAMGTASSPDGTYSLVGLAPGQYKVRFETSGAVPSVLGEWWDGAATEDDAAVLTVDSGSAAEVNARLAAGAVISGAARDGDGAPLAGVEFVVVDATGGWVQNGSTGMDGSFTVGGLGSGAYRVNFTQRLADGSSLSEWWNNAVDFASADDIVVGAGETREGIDITLSPDDGSVVETYSGMLSGIVTDALGNPLPDVEVAVEGELWGDVTSTDASGRWTVPTLPSGPYRVSFTAEINGQKYTQWWDGAADRESASVIRLGVGEERAGIDAVLGQSVLPLIDSSTPKITGPARVGGTLKAHPREWTEGTQFSYQWSADGVPIPGATDVSLLVTPDLAGVIVSVEVTGTLAGYQSITETSALTKPILKR